jgi:tetratricopeptide (TPR) repeat protein
LALVAAFGVVALAALAGGGFLFVNSRRATGVQADTQIANNAEPSPSATAAPPIAQPSNQQLDQQADQQSGADANNQSQPQNRPQSGSSIKGAKSPAVHNAEVASNPQRQAVVNPTPATQQEKQSAEGAGTIEQNGMALLNAGRFQEALREFDRVRKLDSANRNVYYLIGRAYQGMNQPEQALEAYRQCTSGHYAGVAQSAVTNLEKKLKKVSAK